ncbi:MAG: DUF2529 family protein [Bacillaceae bacterium]
MLKIFTTQLSGIFSRIQQQEELNLEEGARLIAQACIGEGKTYVIGFEEVNGLIAQVTSGEGAIPQSCSFTNIEDVTSADRVLLLSPTSTNEEALALAKKLEEKGILTIGISAIIQGEQSLEQIVDVHIDTKATRGLVPTEEGERIGKPTVLATSFVLQGLQFIVNEIMEEY